MCRCKTAFHSLERTNRRITRFTVFPWRALLCVLPDKDFKLRVGNKKVEIHTKNKNDEEYLFAYIISVFPSLFCSQARAAFKSVISSCICIRCSFIWYNMYKQTVAGAHDNVNARLVFTLVYRELWWMKAELKREWAIHMKCKYIKGLLNRCIH